MIPDEQSMVSTLPSTDSIIPSSRQYLESDGFESPNQRLLPLGARTNGHDHLEIGGCDDVEPVQEFGSPRYI